MLLKVFLPQTRRHVFITNMMGIKNYVVAINKMDLVNYSESVFEQIKKDTFELFSSISVHSLICIPVSATQGDNVNRLSSNMPFYSEVSLLDHLNNVNVNNISQEQVRGLVFPVQRVQRGVNGFRSYQGEIVSGSIEVGQQVLAMPSKLMVNVESIFVGNKKVEKASASQAVSIRFDKEIDLVRGDVVVTDEIKVASNFNARVLWTSDDELNKNKDYIIRIHTKQTLATIKEWDLVSLTFLRAHHLECYQELHY
jgi:sulfate adenylyltransferase subunit 1